MKSLSSYLNSFLRLLSQLHPLLRNLLCAKPLPLLIGYPVSISYFPSLYSLLQLVLVHSSSPLCLHPSHISNVEQRPTIHWSSLSSSIITQVASSISLRCCSLEVAWCHLLTLHNSSDLVLLSMVSLT